MYIKNGKLTLTEINTILQKQNIDVTNQNIIAQQIFTCMADVGIIKIEDSNIQANEIHYTTSEDATITMQNVTSKTQNTSIQSKGIGASIRLQGDGAYIQQTPTSISIGIKNKL